MKRVLLTVVVLLVSLPSLAQPKRRVLDKKFWLAVGTVVALTVADVELTQHCIRNRTCREGNPLLGQSRGRAYGVNAAILVPMTIVSYHLKKNQDMNRRKKGDIRWWVIPVVKSSSHIAGMAITLSLRGDRKSVPATPPVLQTLGSFAPAVQDQPVGNFRLPPTLPHQFLLLPSAGSSPKR